MKRARKYKLDREEKELLRSVERGEWQSVKNLKRELKKYRIYAKATLKSKMSGQDKPIGKMTKVDDFLPPSEKLAVRKGRPKEKMRTEDFDKRFNKGKDMGSFLDTKKARINKRRQKITK